MSFTGTYQLVVTANGTTCLGTVTKTASMGIDPIDATIAAGDVGTLTRSDADTGVFTRTSGTAVDNSEVVDVFWEGGIRYGLTATTAGTSGQQFTLDGGAGDDLPSDAATAVYVATQVTYPVDFAGDDVQVIGASSSQRLNVVFYDGASVILAQEIVANSAWGWASEMGIDNPFASDDISSITVTCGSATAASFKLAGLLT
jgi:hypothetical protein